MNFKKGDRVKCICDKNFNPYMKWPEFKVGDRVRCINNSFLPFGEILILGKIYVVQEMRNYMTVCVNGLGYYSYRFEKVDYDVII